MALTMTRDDCWLRGTFNGKRTSCRSSPSAPAPNSTTISSSPTCAAADASRAGGESSASAHAPRSALTRRTAPRRPTPGAASCAALDTGSFAARSVVSPSGSAVAHQWAACARPPRRAAPPTRGMLTAGREPNAYRGFGWARPVTHTATRCAAPGRAPTSRALPRYQARRGRDRTGPGRTGRRGTGPPRTLA